ncbi:MAG TPA: DoxX family protein [Thermoanaerobaculia bacterium]|nr:DoxX family protein [Thermoanaerobaculia bacterium]
MAKRKPITYVLWTLQILLALLFIWGGAFKLVAPIEKLAGPVPLPGLFLRFIGLVELLGGLGLILPAALRIRPILTPLAAAGLVTVMIGATVITLMGGLGLMALFPLVTGLLAAFIAYGRWRLAPIRGRGDSLNAELRPLSTQP